MYAPPVRIKKIEAMLQAGDVKSAEDNVVPSEMYLLAVALAPKDQDSPLAADIRRTPLRPARRSVRDPFRACSERPNRRSRIPISRSC